MGSKQGRRPAGCVQTKRTYSPKLTAPRPSRVTLASATVDLSSQWDTAMFVRACVFHSKTHTHTFIVPSAVSTPKTTANVKTMTQCFASATDGKSVENFSRDGPPLLHSFSGNRCFEKVSAKWNLQCTDCTGFPMRVAFSKKSRRSRRSSCRRKCFPCVFHVTSLPSCRL